LLQNTTTWAALWPSGHVKLGLGYKPDQGDVWGDTNGRFVYKLNADIKPWLTPFYLGAEILLSDPSNGGGDSSLSVSDVSLKTWEFTPYLKMEKDFFLLDVYTGVGLTFLKAEVDYNNSVRYTSDSSSGWGGTFFIGLDDIQIYFPIIDWGIEYRFTSVGLDFLGRDRDYKSSTFFIHLGTDW